MSASAVERPSTSLRQKTLSGLSWSLVAQVVSQACRFGVSVILARLLSPADFGVLGMTLVFTGFASLFGDFGFGSALVQKQDADERHYSSVYWLNQAIGLGLAGVTIVAAPLVARFYRQPLLAPITMLVAVSFPIAAQSLVQKAILYKRMHFRALGIVDVASETIAGVAAIALALHGAGVWSLVWQALIAAIVTAIGSVIATRWFPRFIFHRASVRELAGFSSNLMAYTGFNYWYRNGDNLLVGRFFGSVALGLYSRAYNLMMLPLSQVTTVVSKVMFPALAAMQNDKERVREVYLRAIAMIALVTCPIMLGLMSVSDHFVLAVYGPAWSGVVPVLRIFCILGMLQSVYTTVGWIFQCQGRTDLMLRWGLISGSLSIAAMLVGIYMGTLQSVALLLTIIAVVLLPFDYRYPKRLVQVGIRDAARSVSGVLACSIGMALIVWALGTRLPQSWPHARFLLVQVPVGAVVYFALIHLFNLAPYNECRVLFVRHVNASAERHEEHALVAAATALAGSSAGCE